MISNIANMNQLADLEVFIDEEFNQVCTPTSSTEHCAPHAQHLPPDVGRKIWAARDTHGFGEGALKGLQEHCWGGPIRKRMHILNNWQLSSSQNFRGKTSRVLNNQTAISPLLLLQIESFPWQPHY